MLKEVKQKPIFDKVLKHETKWIQLGYKCKEVNFMNVTVCILCIVIQLLQFKPSNAHHFIKITINCNFYCNFNTIVRPCWFELQ